MNILVTGSAGFIGSQVARGLLEQGHSVVGIDSLNTYYPAIIKQKRHEHLQTFNTFTPYKRELQDYDFLCDVIADHDIELVCNLAAQAGVRYSIEKPFEYQKANLEGFLNVLEACRHNGVKRLVYASSSSVYGGNEKLPFSEKDFVSRPVSLYAATKAANELMAHSYTHLYGLQTVGLRFFTVYGPWGRPDMALWLFTEAMTRNLPIRVFNGGDMKRDFTYVDDIVQGVHASLFNSNLNPYELFNLGNHQCENLMEMIECIASALGCEPMMEMLPMQPGDVHATYADISYAQAKLGFSPKTPMKTGIKAFVKWYQENPELTQSVWDAKQKAAAK
ncbi:MAG: NAD-dependent epimerase/dehydratase family protein [Sumerlaeia bacterium]